MQRLNFVLENELNGLGGKVMGLWNLIQNGYEVPLTFVVMPDEKMTDDEFEQTSVSKNIIQVLSSYGRIDQLWAVRSSAPHEDGNENSYAGQNETYLNISALEVPRYIEKCRASARLSTDYAKQAGNEADSTLVVIVQQMVKDVSYAGVLFTGNPDTGNRHESVIEYVEGLGDKLVGGTQNPIETIVTQLDATFVSKEEKVTRGVTYMLSELRELEEIYENKPVDIEWAVDKYGGITFLQIRPLTGVNWDYSQLNGMGIGKQEVSGTVQRLQHMEIKKTGAKLPYFSEGNILVSKMTDPRMINEMIASAAIVTEIGGRTCHAAIVSRELGKPCLVGCASARFLTNGDKIIVKPSEGKFEYVTS